MPDVRPIFAGIDLATLTEASVPPCPDCPQGGHTVVMCPEPTGPWWVACLDCMSYWETDWRPPEPIQWEGDLEDDCTAVWQGLMLRAECMYEGHWWWAVSDNQGRRGCNELASSNDDRRTHGDSGQHARALAEQAARWIRDPTCPECGNTYMDCHCRCPEIEDEWYQRVVYGVDLQRQEEPVTQSNPRRCNAPSPPPDAVHCSLAKGHDGDHWYCGLGWARGEG